MRMNAISCDKNLEVMNNQMNVQQEIPVRNQLNFFALLIANFLEAVNQHYYKIAHLYYSSDRTQSASLLALLENAN